MKPDFPASLSFYDLLPVSLSLKYLPGWNIDPCQTRYGIDSRLLPLYISFAENHQDTVICEPQHLPPLYTTVTRNITAPLKVVNTKEEEDITTPSTYLSSSGVLQNHASPTTS